MGRGKLGCGAKAAPPLIVTLGKLANRLPDEFPAGCAGAGLPLLLQMGGEGVPGDQHSRPIFPP